MRSLILGNDSWNALIPHSDDCRIDVASLAISSIVSAMKRMLKWKWGRQQGVMGMKRRKKHVTAIWHY